MSQESDFHFRIRYFNKIIVASIIAFFLGIILIIGSYIAVAANPNPNKKKTDPLTVTEYVSYTGGGLVALGVLGFFGIAMSSDEPKGHGLNEWYAFVKNREQSK